jgi:hypothetical protein
MKKAELRGANDVHVDDSAKPGHVVARPRAARVDRVLVSAALSTTTTEHETRTDERGARRVGYSVREASALLGRRADALRREIERHAVLEGGQIVARLAGGIAAYRRKEGGRWLVSIPAHLRA